MRKLPVIIVTLCGLLHASQDPVAVTLSGTVKDQAGDPLKGVIVSLAGIDDLSAETGDSGTFTLSNTTIALTPGNLKASYGLTIRNNAVVLTGVSGKVSGTISLHSGDGRLITSVNLNDLHAGQRLIAVPELSAGIYLLKGTIGGESFTRSLVCMGKAVYTGNEAAKANGNGSPALGKRPAALISDTLIASKDGYDTARVPLDSYSRDDIEVMLTEKGAGGFVITSTAFEDGDKMPDAYTCEGKTFSGMIAPPLAWSGAKAETKSFAMTFLDLTILATPNPANAYHWAMWNIPSTVTQLPEGFGGDQYNQKSAMGGTNKFFGPCPSGMTATRAKDTYAFTLYAFNQETITPASTSVQTLVNWFKQNAIDSTRISVWSDAKATGF